MKSNFAILKKTRYLQRISMRAARAFTAQLLTMVLTLLFTGCYKDVSVQELMYKYDFGKDPSETQNKGCLRTNFDGQVTILCHKTYSFYAVR